MIKYPDEFMDSMKNIFKNQRFSFFLSHPIFSLNYIYLVIRRLLGKLKKFIKRA